MLKISTGKINRAVKTVVYGSEGIGKSTFASHFPDPLFIDTEGGTSQMDVRRIEKPETWEELLSVGERAFFMCGRLKSLYIPPVCKQIDITYANPSHSHRVQIAHLDSSHNG